MLKLELIGNLGADAEIVTTDGAKFVSFRVAHSEKWTGADGKEQSTTMWIDCIIQNVDSKVVPFLKSGTKVFIRGYASTRVYSSKKDRCMKAGLTCKVLEVELCGGASDDVPRQLIEPSSGALIDVTKHYWANIDTKAIKKDEYFELIDKQGNRYQGNKAGFVVPVKEEESENHEAERTE